MNELQSSDVQFGFKQGHSTTLRILICDGNNVYSCLLDAKAFDRVHYGSLLRLLLKNKIPRYILRLSLDSYTKQASCDLWSNMKSRYFTMASGVKQGGVIFPIFLACI